ncbi:MAG: 7-cyano-7-deazaguanine synthase [archaeon]
MPKNRCLILTSGGLDSRLAVKIMQEQKYDVLALHFKLPFSKDIESEISQFCKSQKAKLKIINCTNGKLFQEYLNIIRKPQYGRGTCMNTCIDCKIFILKKAKEFANKLGIKITATGEVEGQRPMSQTKKSLDTIEEKIGLKGRIIRPLTDIYKIHGRRRDKQIALAKKFKITYPSPGGGCLLCETLYCEKLKKILDEKLTFKDIELLKIGRHFKSSQIILGKDDQENKFLEKQKGIKIIPKQPGPTALIKDKKHKAEAKKLIRKYSKHKIEGFETRG